MAVKSRKETHDEDVIHPWEFGDGLIAAQQRPPYLSASVELVQDLQIQDPNSIVQSFNFYTYSRVLEIH